MSASPTSLFIKWSNTVCAEFTSMSTGSGFSSGIAPTFSTFSYKYVPSAPVSLNLILL